MPPCTHTTVALSNGGFTGLGSEKVWPYLLDLTGKVDPLVCFVGTATGDAPDMIVSFYESVLKFGTRATHLPLFRSLGPERTRDQLLGADLVFVGGGNTAAMLSVWRQHGIDTLLAEAAANGVITAGASAGAICWFDSYVTDSFGDADPMHDGLGWVGGAACTHWDTEPLRRARLPEHIKAGFPATYAIEDGTGLLLRDGRIADAISAIDGKRVFRLSDDGEGDIVQVELDITYL